MKILHFSLGAAVMMASVVVTAGPALAEPPSNDTYEGRVIVPSLPFTDERSTVEATTDPEDDALNASCGAPATGASVWFEYTADATTGLSVDAAASDYSTGIFVAVGAPGSWSLVTCSPRTAAWQAVPGTAYAIVVFDDENPGPGAGGNLVLSITETRLPEIELTVDPLGAFNRTTGEATVSGTVVCTGDDAEGALEVQLTQRVDALKIVGFGGTPVTCDGVVRPWSVLVTSGNGYYTRGPADAVTTGSVCANALCTNYLNEQPVELRPAQRVRS